MDAFRKSGTAVRKKIKAVDATVARNYYMESGYLSSSFQLPEFFVGHGLDAVNLVPLNYKKNNGVRRTYPINVYAPKGVRSWRRFSIVHPYAYWHIVDELTNPQTWSEIVSILGKPSDIACYSLPVFNSKLKQQGVGIKSWKKFAEDDLVKVSPEFKYLVTTDIKSFYPSVYTHSIAWALNGKDEAKADGKKYKLSGNRVDKLFQNARGGQTNGIPIGTAVSDLVSEIILARVDVLLTEKIAKSKKQIVYVAGRYRDDYKFLCNSITDGEYILKCLNRILHEQYDLSLNDDKTNIYDDIIAGSLRPWDIEIKNSPIVGRTKELRRGQAVNIESLKIFLMETYRIQNKYPNGRASITLLSLMARKLANMKSFKATISDIDYCTSLLRKILLLREDVTPHAMSLIDRLLEFYTSKNKEKILQQMHDTFSQMEDWEYQEVWLYRLYQHHSAATIPQVFNSSSNPLVQILLDGSGHDWKYFPNGDSFESSDELELDKFKLVDRALLLDTINSPIDLDAINAFTYST